MIPPKIKTYTVAAVLDITDDLESPSAYIDAEMSNFLQTVRWLKKEFSVNVGATLAAHQPLSSSPHGRTAHQRARQEVTKEIRTELPQQLGRSSPSLSDLWTTPETWNQVCSAVGGAARGYIISQAEIER